MRLVPFRILGQSDNPNATLTSPQPNRLLTLVAERLVVCLREAHRAILILEERRAPAQSAL